MVSCDNITIEREIQKEVNYMNRLNTDILQWIHRTSKAQTLEKLDAYFRTTEQVMKVYQGAHLITMDEYRELDGRLVSTYYQRYKDICVEQYRKIDEEFIKSLREER